MLDFFEKRISICEKCESYDLQEKRCNECHCYMPVKAMVPFADCPQNKWDKPIPTEK